MLILTPRAEIKFVGRQHTSDEVVVKEQFVENVYRIKKEYLGNTGVVVDIGANIGAFSIYAYTLMDKETAKKGWVYAYEPILSNFKLLKENIELNGLYANIKPVNKAVGNYNGIVGLIDKQGDSYVCAPEVKPTDQAPMITLEEVFIENGIAYADILKIDIEGGEYDLIEAVPRDFLNKVNYICMEFHATTVKRFGALISKLTVTHKVEILGAYNKGGQIYATKY